MKQLSGEALARVGIEIFLLALALYFFLVFVLIALGAVAIFLPIYLLSGEEGLKRLVEPC